MDAYASRAPGQVGIDLFGSPSLFARGWSKVVRGLLAEVQGAAAATAGAAALVRACLDALASAPIEVRPAPGCGATLHGTSGGLTVGGVALDRSLYHLLVVAA